MALIRRELSRLLPTASELPQSVLEAFDEDGATTVKKSNLNYTFLSWPDTFGYQQFVGTVRGTIASTSMGDQDIFLLLSSYQKPSAAEEAWRNNPVSRLFPEINEDSIWPPSKAFHQVPKRTFGNTGSVWDGQCYIEGVEEDLSVPGACSSFVASTHFCNWVLIVNMSNNHQLNWSIDDPRLGALFKDSAATVMRKVGCDHQQ